MEPTEVSFGNPQESAKFMDPSLCQIFTKGKEGEINSHQHNLRENPPPIPSEEKKFAEAVFLDIYDERGNKKKVLRIDLLSDDVNIPEAIFYIVRFYNERFNSSSDWLKAKGDLVVMINLFSRNVSGTVRIPLERLLNPTQNLRIFLENLPKVLERRRIRYFLRRAIEKIKKEDNFLKCLYQRDDESAKKLVLESLRAYDFFENLSKEGLGYFNKFLERLYNRFIDLRNHFSFPVSLLDLQEKSLEDQIAKIPAISNDVFIPLITRGEGTEKREIPLSSIITAEAKETGTRGDNWLDYLIRRGENYMKNFIRACLRGDLNLLRPHFDGGYNLLHLGNGYYMVLNGRHRTAAAKLLGLEFIEANVYNLLPQKGERREIFTTNLREIKRRVELGLIKGKFFLEEGRIFLIVEDFEGPWVFYQDMEKARRFFTQTNIFPS